MFDPNDTVDVLHPNGGIITIPAAVAQQAGVPPGMIVPRAAGPEYNLPAGTVGSQIPTPPPPPPPPPPTAKIGAAPVAQAGDNEVPNPAFGAKSGGAPAATQVPSQAAVDAATPPAPPPPPMTGDELRSRGEADVLAKTNAAIEAGAKAGAKAAQVEAAGHDAMADMYAQERQRQDDIAAARAKEANANLLRINQKAASIDAAINDVATVKIDRTSSHPILNAIGLALGAIGQGMSHGDKNPAFDALATAIDRKVQGQVQDRANAVQAIGLQRESLANLQQQFTDRNAYYDALTAAETKRTIALGDELTQRSTSQTVKANWQVTRAALQQKQAEAQGAALDKENAKFERDRAFKEEQRQHNVSAGLQARGLDQADRHFNAQMDFEKSKWSDERELKAAELLEKGDPKAKLLQAQTDAINERGVFAPNGTKTEKRPDGSSVSSPTFAPLMQQDGVTPFLVPKDEHKEFAQQQGAILQGLDAVDKLRQLRHKNGGQLTNSVEALEATQEYARYILALHKAGGITRMSGEVIEKMEQIASGGRDPNSLRAVQATLENSRKDLVDQYNINLRGQNYTGKRVDFPDQIKQAVPTDSDMKNIKRPLEIPAPDVTEGNQAKRSMRLLEEQARSEDPATKKEARETLMRYASKAPNEWTKRMAAKAINNIALGKEPNMPDPEKYPKLYGDE